MLDHFVRPGQAGISPGFIGVNRGCVLGMGFHEPLQGRSVRSRYRRRLAHRPPAGPEFLAGVFVALLAADAGAIVAPLYSIVRRPISERNRASGVLG